MCALIIYIRWHIGTATTIFDIFLWKICQVCTGVYNPESLLWWLIDLIIDQISIFDGIFRAGTTWLYRCEDFLIFFHHSYTSKFAVTAAVDFYSFGSVMPENECFNWRTIVLRPYIEPYALRGPFSTEHDVHYLYSSVRIDLFDCSYRETFWNAVGDIE